MKKWESGLSRDQEVAARFCSLLILLEIAGYGYHNVSYTRMVLKDFKPSAMAMSMAASMNLHHQFLVMVPWKERELR